MILLIHRTQKECAELCETEPPVPTEAPVTADDDLCSQPLVQGDCEAYIPSYGFDPKLAECVHFVYGGCGGNKNRFR